MLEQSKSEVESILSSAPADVERMLSSLNTLFPHKTLSAASAAFTSSLTVESADNAGNKVVTDALFAVRDEIEAAVAKIMAFER